MDQKVLGSQIISLLRKEIWACGEKKHGSEVISSCFSDLQKTYPNCAQELAQNYCSGGSFISLTDAFFNWHVLREEINPSTTNDNNDDGIGESLGIATTNSLSVRKLFFPSFL